ncbi:hypothetical protein Sjap_016635 [Stephania japonica]|uniref:ATPase AAA-type core domain-containing protein n=1 Tax=Stephania japonica TaxID=461633 RepID=A0AAP0ILD9_9MAGN
MIDRVSKLVGSPPGYVGHGEGGQLTDIVRKRPCNAILLDEVEKAHRDVFDILLQILEYGRLTDGKGRIVDFKNTCIIMTSNIGSEAMEIQTQNGFFKKKKGNQDGSHQLKNKAVEEELKKHFRVEFLNRIDEVIIFNKLEKKQLCRVVDIIVKEVSEILKEKKIQLKVNNNSQTKLSKMDIVQGMGKVTKADIIEAFGRHSC